MEDKKLEWHIILNPISGGKKSLHLWKKIETVLFDSAISFKKYESKFAGNTISITQEIITLGGKNFILIGGDGTANEVINGIFNSTNNPSEFTIAMISAGTGNDWIKTIGNYSSISTIVTSLNQKNTFLHDVGLLSFINDGKKNKRYFLNIAGLGFDGMVVKKLNEGKSIFKGTKIQYWLAILRSLLFYQLKNITFLIDDVEKTSKTLTAAIGNCQYNGAGMKQLPNAIMDDGLLDITIIGDMPKWKMILNLPKLSNGTFIKLKEVKTYRAKKIVVTSKDLIFVEVDGEFVGETPAEISVIHRGIQVLKWL